MEELVGRGDEGALVPTCQESQVSRFRNERISVDIRPIWSTTASETGESHRTVRVPTDTFVGRRSSYGRPPTRTARGRSWHVFASDSRNHLGMYAKERERRPRASLSQVREFDGRETRRVIFKTSALNGTWGVENTRHH